MNAMKNKIKSQRGASITFALLLFLVCAVISSAVIVAATAAAGRLSTMEEMDERYYAVTDACELLCKRLDGKTVTVQYTIKEDGTVSATADVSGNPILKDVSEKLISQKEGNILPEGLTQPIQIKVDDGTTEYSCKIQETLQGGTLTFDVSAEGGIINKGTYKAYKLSVIFASNVKYSAVDSSSPSQTAIVTWKLRSLKKNRPVLTPSSTTAPGS